MGKRKSRKPGHYCRANAEASPGRFGGLLIGKGDGKDKMFPIDAPLCLIGRLDMISLIGKKGRDVAAILTPEMKRALDILVTSRATVGIDALNRYLFPRSTGDGHIEGHVCLSKLAYDADLKYPERIGSTKLRKYIATVVQMLNLEHGELEWLSNHLGHTIDVHKEFYRNQEGAVQLGKVAKMLIAVDQGRILDNQTDENADGDVSNQNPDEQWLVLDDSSSDDEDDDVSGEASAKKSSESNASLDAHRRKSAVELLEASKGEYVKSRQVLNQRQELKHPENLSISSDPVALLPVQTRHAALEDVSNTLTEDNNNRKLSVSEDQAKTSTPSSHHGPTQNENKPRCQSPKTSLGVKTPESCQPGSEEQGAQFKKPSTPPKLPPRPVVPPKPATKTTSPVPGLPPKPATKPTTPPVPGLPPKPATKPTTPPVPGPKPSTLLNLDNTGKPVPPPRPSRLPVDQTDSSSSKMSAIAADTPGASAATTNNNEASDILPKRFSSLSAHATVGKDSGDKDSASDKLGAGSRVGRDRDARCSIGSQSDAMLKPLCSSSLSTSVGVLLEKPRSPAPKPRVNQKLDEPLPPPRRQLHRSHSDLSSCRHSRASSDFSDLSSRLSRNSTEVERFFNEMGLDRTVLEPMRKLAETRRKDPMADSYSSLDSISGQSLSSRLSQNDLDKLPMESEQDLMDRSTASGATSVVERNARIIKWLCNVKKARTAPGQVKKTKPAQSTVKPL